MIPPLHVLERIRRRIPDLFLAEEFLDAVDELSWDVDELHLRTPSRRLDPHDGDHHIGAPHDPEGDEIVLIEAIDHLIEEATR